MRHVPYFVLTLALFAAVALPAAAASALQYDRAAMAAGEWWRLVTCQWTHWSVTHLWWDTATFVALGVVCECQGRAGTVLTVAFAAIGIPLVVHAVCPAIGTFRGLSGIDCALFGLLTARLAEGAWADRERGMYRVVVAFWLLFVGKTVFEAVTGRCLFVSDPGGFAVVPAAHLTGVLVGSGVACVAAIRPSAAAGLQAVPSGR